MRNRMVDITKALAIYLVVLGHLQTNFAGWTQTAVLIATCHMPAFFFISGLFFEGSFRKYGKLSFVKNKVRALLIPYLMWSSVSFVVNILSLVSSGNIHSIWDEFVDVYINARSVWFLIMLFFTNIVTWMIWTTCKGSRKKAFAICAVIWLAALFLLGQVQTLHFYKFCWLYPYYLLGIVFHEKCNLETMREKMNHFPLWKRLTALVVSVGGYSIITLLAYKEERFEAFYTQFQLLPKDAAWYLLYYLLGVLGIMALLELAVLIDSCAGAKAADVISNVGKCSIDIYVMHMFLVRVVLAVTGDKGSQWMMVVFALFITACLYLIAKHVLRRFWLYRISVGER